jgi:anti-sigma B factor antagonist
VAKVRVTGELDLATNDRLREGLRSVMARGCARLELDLAGVSFIDASSLRVLDQEQRRFAESGGTLEVVAASRCHLRVSELAGYRNLQPPSAHPDVTPLAHGDATAGS